MKDAALQFRTQHPFCRQEAVPAGSQQLWAQDLAPVQRCGTKGRTGHQGRERGNDDGNRGGDGGVSGNENEDKTVTRTGTGRE